MADTITFRPDEDAARALAVLTRDLPLSTSLVAPTSTSARAATFRPEVEVDGRPTRVLVEQAADPTRPASGVSSGISGSTSYAGWRPRCGRC